MPRRDWRQLLSVRETRNQDILEHSVNFSRSRTILKAEQSDKNYFQGHTSKLGKGEKEAIEAGSRFCSALKFRKQNCNATSSEQIFDSFLKKNVIEENKILSDSNSEPLFYCKRPK